MSVTGGRWLRDASTAVADRRAIPKTHALASPVPEQEAPLMLIMRSTGILILTHRVARKP